MRKIGDFEIVDHGIHGIGEFQGCEFPFESFNHIATGIGNDMAEAIHDCINQMRMVDFNVENMNIRILEQRGWDLFPTEPCIDRRIERCDFFYHVLIRWNGLLSV